MLDLDAQQRNAEHAKAVAEAEMMDKANAARNQAVCEQVAILRIKLLELDTQFGKGLLLRTELADRAAEAVMAANSEVTKEYVKRVWIGDPAHVMRELLCVRPLLYKDIFIDEEMLQITPMDGQLDALLHKMIELLGLDNATVRYSETGEAFVEAWIVTPA